MRAAVLAIALTACGNDSTPQEIDAPTTPSDGGIDAAMIDAPMAVNGCMRAIATDLTAPGATRTIVITDDKYTPRCPRITVGQSVTWNGDFGEHPLAPGIIRGSQLTTQPGSPIQSVTNGTTTTVTFTAAGDWAFYCPQHSPGMSGMIYVDP